MNIFYLIPVLTVNPPEFYSLPPSLELAPFVECIWAVRAWGRLPDEVVIPNGAIELMFNFGPTQHVLAYADQRVDQPFEKFWLAGIQDQPLSIASRSGSDLLGVRFRPGGAHAFLNMPMSEMTDQVIDLDLIIGSNASPLRDALGDARSHEERCRIVEDWLLARRRFVHHQFDRTRQAVEILNSHSFRAGVGDVCNALGLSNKHLIDQFKTVVGLTPKTLGRIARFHSVVRAVRGIAEPEWAALAVRHGFADQAHLIREFRQFAGVTPGQFIRQRTADHLHLELPIGS